VKRWKPPSEASESDAAMQTTPMGA